jgi:hypothetical protein
VFIHPINFACCLKELLSYLGRRPGAAVSIKWLDSLVAEHSLSKREVVGSIPTRALILLASQP